MVLVLSEEHKVHLSFLTQVDVEGTCGIQWLHAAMLISGVGVASRLALNFLPPLPSLSLSVFYSCSFAGFLYSSLRKEQTPNSTSQLAISGCGCGYVRKVR